MRYSCQFRPDLKMECPEYGGRATLLSSQSVVRLPQSACKITFRLDPFGFGKDETLNGQRVIQSDHLCIRNDAEQENSSLKTFCLAAIKAGKPQPSVPTVSRC
jgi:hypothetical protein